MFAYKPWARAFVKLLEESGAGNVADGNVADGIAIFEVLASWAKTLPKDRKSVV